MFSGKYYVQHIDYKRYTISLSDAGAVEDTNCSSIPRYFLYDRSFHNILYGEQDFGSEPFLLDLSPPRVAYFNCSNPVKDPRYVTVDTSHCSIRGNGHVYAVLEQSLSEYSFEDIKIGCEFMVATLTKEWFEDIRKGNVSYDEIHGLIVDGFEVSWLPAVCESRCGKGTICE
ncbi:hypothetical protein L195_g026044, partial [Trifolium pratense]